MRHKRFAFLRKNAKIVIPCLIFIILFFSFINETQSSEGLSNMYSVADLEKDTDINTINNSLDYTIAQSQSLGKGERGLFAKKNYKENDLIEICPTLKMNGSEIDKKKCITYIFF